MGELTEGGGCATKKKVIKRSNKPCISGNAVVVALACDILNGCSQFEHAWYASYNTTFGGHKSVSLYCYFTNS